MIADHLPIVTNEYMYVHYIELYSVVELHRVHSLYTVTKARGLVISQAPLGIHPPVLSSLSQTEHDANPWKPAGIRVRYKEMA
jgi:hypothetical protein